MCHYTILTETQKNILQMKLGDIVYYITFYTGIHYLVKTISKKLGKDCGCDKRRDQWNSL